MLHADRRRAESFGSQADRYDRARPSYPEALFDVVIGVPGTGADVLDVGCGTGIAARQMTARGARVLGVEIDRRMAAVARGHGVTVEIGRFETWDPRGRTFDVVTAGQAWHWIEPAAGAARAAEVLRPGGRLALFWNIGHLPEDLAAELDRVYAAVAPGADRYSVILGYSRDDRYPDYLEAIAAHGFDEPVRVYFDWEREYSVGEWIDQLPTHSDHARLEPPVLERLLDGVAGAIERHGGRFTMRYQTMLIRADKPA